MATNVSIERRKAAALALRGYRCFCGEKKDPMSVACNTCWSKLPKHLRFRLTRMLKGTFVMSFEEARVILTRIIELPVVEVSDAPV